MSEARKHKVMMPPDATVGLPLLLGSKHIISLGNKNAYFSFYEDKYF